MRPKLTTNTAVTSRKPISIHRKYDVLRTPAEQGVDATEDIQEEIKVMEPLMVTINFFVVLMLVRAVHL